MINFSNFRDHPSDHRYKVFQFHNKERANYFEDLLKKEGIWFERADETEEGRQVFFFGVKRLDFKLANKLNYLVSAKYRKPFMPNKMFRILVVGLSLLAIAIAIAGVLIKG